MKARRTEDAADAVRSCRGVAWVGSRGVGKETTRPADYNTAILCEALQMVENLGKWECETWERWMINCSIPLILIGIIQTMVGAFMDEDGYLNFILRDFLGLSLSADKWNESKQKTSKQNAPSLKALFVSLVRRTCWIDSFFGQPHTSRQVSTNCLFC